MIAMMYRPTPQIPRPTLKAALRCYDAVVPNIYMHQAQIKSRSVDMTWIFTQAIFMTINTILWSLSYYEVRMAHPREEVQGHLDVALGCTKQAIERWPGVASAIELYGNLTKACMNIYEKDGDIPIAAGSPPETGPDDRSRTTSPVFQSLAPNTSALKQSQPSPTENSIAPFGYIPNQPSFHSSSPSQQPGPGDHMGRTSLESDASSTAGRMGERASNGSYGNISNFSYENNFDPSQYTNPLPQSYDFNWNPNFNLSQGGAPASVPALSPFDQPHPGLNGYGLGPQAPVQYSDYLYPPSSYDVDRAATGLNQQQHSELMHDLETQGTGQIQHMINASQAFFYPRGRGY
jgi:hypothetical protein